ncbi:MAG: type IV secretion system DNA-binding domain-containing protein [Flavobacteriaceae bacterium]|nr:MAG: type IV secretion system DNA-binding domain-containing protein [Flavobacteriaceae bacterium]
MSIFSYSHSQTSAKFLKGIDRFSLLNRYRKGLVIDGVSRISVKDSMQGLICLGSVGYGKSTAFVVPNLMKIRNASMYVIDPSQELFNLCGEYLKKFFQVDCINTIDPDNSSHWCPLHSVKTREDAKMLADAIVSSAFPQETGSTRFWNESAKSLIYCLIVSVLNRPEQKTLQYVFNMLNRFNEHDKEELIKELSEHLDNETWLEVKAIISQPEKLFGSTVATCRTALAPMATETLKKVSSSNDIDFKGYRKKPSICFICVAENRVKEYGLYLSLLLKEITDTLMIMPEKNDLNQFILYDEAGNIYCPKLANFLTVARKRKVSVSLILQSMRQLRALYGNDAETIIENTKHHIYLPGLSYSTTREISQKIGYKSDGNSTYFPTNKKKEGRSALISPEAIRTLKNGRAIFLSGNMPAVLLKLRPWYKNFWLKLKLKK